MPTPGPVRLTVYDVTGRKVTDLVDTVMEAGGLERKLRVFRLPEENTCLSLTTELDIALKPTGDNPIWVCVTTEDGFQAWSSPIYVFKD